MSLWADYINEIRGDRVFIEYPDCFASYSFPDWVPTCIVIHDMYVTPDLRKSGRGTALLNDICEIGRKAGKTSVIAELEITTKTFQQAFKAQTAVGFVPIAAKNDIICMRKEIANG